MSPIRRRTHIRLMFLKLFTAAHIKASISGRIDRGVEHEHPQSNKGFLLSCLSGIQFLLFTASENVFIQNEQFSRGSNNSSFE